MYIFHGLMHGMALIGLLWVCKTQEMEEWSSVLLNGWEMKGSVDALGGVLGWEGSSCLYHV